MEWIVGGCLLVLIFIWGSVMSAVEVLKNIDRSIQQTRLDLSRDAKDIIHELVVAGADVSSAEKNIENLAKRYAPLESDVDRFEREMVLKK